MRVFGILVTLLVIAGLGLFFWLYGDGEPELANKETPTASPVKKKEERVEQATDPSEPSSPKATANIELPSEPAPQDPDGKPVIITKEDSKTDTTSGIAAMAAPAFDVVRVDKNCGLLVAGTSEPTAIVRIFVGDTEIGKTQASRRGEWIYLATDPLPKGPQQINAKAVNPNGQEVETARMVIMQVPDCTKAIEERAPAIALLTPKSEDKKEAFNKRISKLLQLPEPQGDRTAAKDLSVGAIDYNDKGDVALSGKGKPGNDVQVYLENKPVGTATVDEKGNWRLVPEKEIEAGKYTLRADQTDPKGKVISRVEIPFKRESADDVILAKGGLEIRAIVQPGNSLWRIARRMYGEGTHYTTIYQANQEQIKDPDLIFPGQIFKLPSEETTN
ncbi:Ig-like domain-containing protein [Sneathiella sp.]|uniref:Ig-like domain-containing protein n=1 Tax=Sneathiella sp. TaxID=1964365 RepID=UPI0039E483A1